MSTSEQFATIVDEGALLHVSGIVPSLESRAHGVDVQVADVLRQLDSRLRQRQSSLARAVSLQVQLRRAGDFAAMNAAYASCFVSDPPVRTTVVAPPTTPGALVEISAIAAHVDTPRDVVRPAGWKPSPNPYSYGIRCRDIVFLAGMVARSGRTNEVVAGDLATQATIIFDNADDVLDAAGLSLADVVWAKVFLTNTANFDAMNGVYRRRMPTPRPARATAVVSLMNPQYLLEMTFVAMAGKRVVQAARPMLPDAVLSPVIVAGTRVFVSGKPGADPAADIAEQTRSTVARLGEVLFAAGVDWRHVVEATLYVTAPEHAAPARQAWRNAIGRPLPAGSTLVTGLVLPGADVEIMLSALRP